MERKCFSVKEESISRDAFAGGGDKRWEEISAGRKAEIDPSYT